MSASADAQAAPSPQLQALLNRIELETARKPWPEVDQEAYARAHAECRATPFPEESDIEIAGRARMLMRDSIAHEGVCVAVRDRICRLWAEKTDLAEALRLILPLAKGYAATHRVGSNALYIQTAEDLLEKLEEAGR